MTRLRFFLLLGVGFVTLVFWTLAQEPAAIEACREEGGRWDAAEALCLR